MLNKFLKKYSDSNPERFNKDFIMSRSDKDILDYVKSIFKSLEILPEIKIKEVTLETDESDFPPIKQKGVRKKKKKDEETTAIDETDDMQIINGSGEKKNFTTILYKPILKSRLNRIHYKILVMPEKKQSNQETPIEFNEEEKEFEFPEEYSQTKNFIEERNKRGYFYLEGYLFLDKLLDGCFYLNEGVRYYLIYQIVDNASYSTKDTVSLKSLLMPINISKKVFSISSKENEQFDLAEFEVKLFNKKQNPLSYFFLKEAYNSVIQMKYTDENTKMFERIHYKDPSLIDKMNKFFDVNFKFSEKLSDVQADGWSSFEISDSKNIGVYFAAETEKLKNDPLTIAIAGCLLNLKSASITSKRKKFVFTYDNIITPWFWIDNITGFFMKNTDNEKKLIKARTMLISMKRLIDKSTQQILQIDSKDKENCLTIIRYLMREYDSLSKEDSMDLDNKRIRLEEYLLLPLQLYFSNQVYRVLNSPVHSENILEKIFSNLSATSIISEMVVNELLRYYNAPNEINLYTALLKYTYSGAQAIGNKNVSMKQRDIHPSYTGRLSLIAASSSNPGLSGNLTPFVKVYGKYGFFSKKIGEKSFLKNKEEEGEK